MTEYSLLACLLACLLARRARRFMNSFFHLQHLDLPRARDEILISRVPLWWVCVRWKSEALGGVLEGRFEVQAVESASPHCGRTLSCLSHGAAHKLSAPVGVGRRAHVSRDVPCSEIYMSSAPQAIQEILHSNGCYMLHTPTILCSAGHGRTR